MVRNFRLSPMTMQLPIHGSSVLNSLCKKKKKKQGKVYKKETEREKQRKKMDTFRKKQAGDHVRAETRPRHENAKIQDDSRFLYDSETLVHHAFTSPIEPTPYSAEVDVTIYNPYYILL